ncbi:hypothetical protein POTOM_052934 [Populus tomentosa]|uniref:Uncharacterized protein n=1 Tax=Populus tomentosa TaxID=118781 RepID=A0A8X7Y115_POPTO|nr:hypothetical protein POTOM_052934 [Populus tomentosa]
MYCHLQSLVGIEFYDALRGQIFFRTMSIHTYHLSGEHMRAASCSILIAAACGIIYPNSDEEDSISWKLGSNRNLSIKSAGKHMGANIAKAKENLQKKSFLSVRLLALRVHDCFSFARKEMPNGILHNSLA